MKKNIPLIVLGLLVLALGVFWASMQTEEQQEVVKSTIVERSRATISLVVTDTLSFELTMHKINNIVRKLELMEARAKVE